MIAAKTTRLVVIHYDPRDADGDGMAGRSKVLDRTLERLLAYGSWLQREGFSTWLLVPEILRRRFKRSTVAGRYDRILSFRDEADFVLPGPVPRGKVCIVNGRQLPFVDLRRLSKGSAPDADVTVFDDVDSPRAGHYPETVCVDDSGRLLRFRRHYYDSPVFTDRWCGEASIIVTDGVQVRNVAAHLAIHGWNSSSVGLLSRRHSVRWSSPGEGVRPALAARLAMDLEASHDGLLAGLPAEEPTGSSGDAVELLDPPGGRWTADLLEIEEPELDAGDVVAAPHERCDFTDRRRGYEAAKRALDLSLSLMALVVLSPLLLAVAMLVKCTSRGPVLFAHRRQGAGGKEFSCLKFRTMTAGAHEMQDALRAFNEVDGPQFKIDADPRLTRVGRWLRRLNIDELPQLFNVLMGQMSLVGPRPSPDDENQLCPAWRRARLSVKPGMTGLWQVLRRRSDPDRDFQEWIYYDVEYAKRRSLWLDVQILMHTPLAIFASQQRLGRFVTRLSRRGICRYAAEMGWPPTTVE